MNTGQISFIEGYTHTTTVTALCHRVKPVTD